MPERRGLRDRRHCAEQILGHRERKPLEQHGARIEIQRAAVKGEEMVHQRDVYSNTK